MLPRRPTLCTKERQRLFELHGGVCHICKAPIALGHEPWEIDHVIARARIGSSADTDDNMRPAHYACHKIKTKDDVRDIAKADRIRAKEHGFHRPRHVMPGSRASGFKRLVGGGTVRRDAEVRL